MSSTINQEIPVMVRILPMNKQDEWKDWGIPEVQKEFLLKELNTERKGKYHFKSAGMKAKHGSVVLFQFDSKIIGLGILDNIKKRDDQGYFDISTELDNDLEYKGAYYFEPSSIRIFKPVSAEEIKRIWEKEFKRFNQTTQFLDPDKYPEFCGILKNIEEPEET